MITQDELNIRLATAEDIRAIEDIENANDGISWTSRAVLHDIEEGGKATVLIAELGGEVIGYSDIWCVVGESELNIIVIAEAWRRRHYGEALLRATMAEAARSAELMNLEVRGTNWAARALYVKLGFESVGLRENYYWDDFDDAVLMTARLNNEKAIGPNQNNNED